MAETTPIAQVQAATSQPLVQTAAAAMSGLAEVEARTPRPVVQVSEVKPGRVVEVYASVSSPVPAGSASRSAVEHTQSAASASWVIRHDFGRRPLVQIFAANGEQVFPDIIADASAVSVIFAAPTTGSAVLI